MRMQLKNARERLPDYTGALEARVMAAVSSQLTRRHSL